MSIVITTIPELNPQILCNFSIFYLLIGVEVILGQTIQCTCPSSKL